MNLSSRGTKILESNKEIRGTQKESERGKNADGIRYFKPCSYSKYIVIDISPRLGRKTMTPVALLSWVNETIYFLLSNGYDIDGIQLVRLIRLRDELSYCNPNSVITWTPCGRKEIHNTVRYSCNKIKSNIDKRVNQNVFN